MVFGHGFDSRLVHPQIQPEIRGFHKKQRFPAVVLSIGGCFLAAQLGMASAFNAQNCLDCYDKCAFINWMTCKKHLFVVWHITNLDILNKKQAKKIYHL